MRKDKYFDSYESFIRQAIKDGNPKNGKSSTSQDRKHSWDMGAGWEGTLELAKRGWPEGLKRIQKAAELLKLPVGEKSYDPRQVLAVSGDEVDVGLYLSGEPECMYDYEMLETPSFGKVAKIIVNLAGSAGVKAETMFKRGAAAVLLIDALEQSGIRCEVWALPKSTSGDGEPVERGSGKGAFVVHVCVKQADDPVELDRLAFMLAHPAAFRRLGFRIMEQEDEMSFGGRATRSAYGCTMELPEKERSEAGTIYFGGQFLGRLSSEAAMVAEVQKVLGEFLETETTTT